MKKNNKLDEMQELAVLKSESIGHGIAFWGLLIAIVVQVAMGADLSQIMAEWIIFMILCVYMIFSCYKNGIWSRYSLPNNWVNLIGSLASALLVGIMVWGTATSHGWSGIRLIKAIAFFSGITFAATLLLLTLSVKIYNKRRSKLDSE